jgi:transposase
MAKEKLHKEDIPVCVKMKKRGLNDKDIAAYLGVRRETFSQWVNHPRTENQTNLANALKKAEADAKAAMLTAIQKAAMEPKTWQAAAWWLERKYPEEFARPEVQLQREAMRESTDQLIKGFEGVVVKIREAAYGGDSANA